MDTSASQVQDPVAADTISTFQGNGNELPSLWNRNHNLNCLRAIDFGRVSLIWDEFYDPYLLVTSQYST